MRACLLAAVWLAAALSIATTAPISPFFNKSEEVAEQEGNAIRRLSRDDALSYLKGTAPQRPFSSTAMLDNLNQAYEMDDGVEEDASRHHRDGWVYLIRHGEKVKRSDKTGLSERGVQRAKCLTDVFGHQHRIDYILAQDFKPSGQRRRPYETVKPLARKHDIPLDHSCDRDDTHCVAKKIRKKTSRGENVLVVWEHARLSKIADALGVRGLVYPRDRYDVIFKVKRSKVHAIYSEECTGLDKQWFHWKGKRKGKHGRSPHGGRLIDDESWADEDGERTD